MNIAKTLLISLMLLFTPMAFAHEEEVELPDPGTAPDSPLWGLDRAIEKIGIALTFDKGKKVEKRLANANERLAEVHAMIDANKAEHAARAEQAREEEVDEIEAEVKADGGIPEDIKAKVLENLQKHITVLQGVKAKLEEKGLDASGVANAIAKGTEAISRFEQKPTQPAKGNQTKGNETEPGNESVKGKPAGVGKP